MNWAPKNKAFLYIVMLIIVILLGYRLYQGRQVPVSSEGQAPSAEAVQTLLTREMGVRQRHDQLRETVKVWDGHFLQGEPREAGLALLKHVEGWARETGLTYDSTQMQSGAGEKSGSRVGLVIQGSADYPTILRFLQRVETASIAVSIAAIRLKTDASENGLRYELRLEAPLLQSGGGTQK